MTEKKTTKKQNKPTSAPQDQPDPQKRAAMGLQLRDAFSKITMAFMGLPQYRDQNLSDLSHLVLEPLMRDRIMIATAKKSGDEEAVPGMVGFTIWASVSEAVEQKIEGQIKAGVFPVRLKPEDWRSGDRNWVLDIITLNPGFTAGIFASFSETVKNKDLKMHPRVTRMLDQNTPRQPETDTKATESKKKSKTLN